MLPRSLVLALLAIATPACRAIDHPSTVTPTPPSTTVPKTWDDVFAKPAPVEVDVVISARWAVPRKGVLDQNDPRASAAGPANEKVPIVLPFGVVRHAERGDFIVDTGVERATAKGERGAQRGLLRLFLKKIRPMRSLGEVIEHQHLKLAGVLITHMHIDHVLGLPDIDDDTPIWIGPAETIAPMRFGSLMRRTYDQLLRGKAPLRELSSTAGIELGPIARAIDLLGDGSIWAIPSPGHTAGSTAWLINAAKGPVLFVGDTSHTLWGWQHDVVPGKYTDDHATNRTSLAQLRALAAKYPQIRVVLGHEVP